MAELKLTDCLVFVVRNEESRLLVIDTFEENIDRWRLASWLAKQPDLLEFVAEGVRLSGSSHPLFEDLRRAASEDSP